MANEFPQLSDVFALDKQVTYTEAVEQVWLPQDNAILSVPSASPIETLTLSGYTITPTVALGAITYESGTTAELHFIDYSNLRDGAIIQIRILDNTYPITIKNGITGNGGIFTSNGEDILLSDYRKIVQLQREGSIWRQVGTIQSANLPITNCLTEIPQDIKLELNEGTLTLKAGSKVYVPNGFEDDGVTPKFDVVVIESDKTCLGFSAGTCIAFINDNGDLYASLNISPYTGSGSSAPTDFIGLFYNTTTNTIGVRFDTSSQFSSGYSLPIAIVTNASTTVCSAIDQIFNGFGYIGSTVFALPGVKGFIPNGRNEDGTLKNTEFTTDSVWLGQTAYNTNKATLGIVSDMKAVVYVTDNDVVYDERYNKNKRVSDGVYWQGCFAGAVSVSDMKFTSLQPKLPFRAADYNDMQLKQDKATAVNYDNITNCITEIPQDIKLELVDGTLTLKAGSKVYVPNRAGKFDVVTVDGDKNIFDTTKNEKYFLVYAADKKSVTLASVNDSVSGVGAVPNVGLSAGYDTSTNIIKRYNGDLSVAFNLCSFPLAVTTWVAGSGCVSIDQVFNGFGYIGSTVFALPGVKGLIPNGRNEDGSLRNIEVLTKNVATLTFASNVNTPNNGRFLLNSTGGIFARVGSYDDVNNYNLGANGADILLGCSFAEGCLVEAGVIKTFNSKPTFHAVDYNDLIVKADKSQFQVVSTLPSSPNADTFYFIPE